jgi:hypothetical protein
MDEGVRIFACQYLKYLKGSLTCRKILRHGASGFTSQPKEGVLQIFIALKKSIASAGFDPATLGSSGSYTNHYTTEATKIGHGLLLSQFPRDIAVDCRNVIFKCAQLF